MKNLKLSCELTSNLQLQSEDEALRFAAFDIERNRLFFASSANSVYATHLPSSQDERTWRTTTLSMAIQPLDLEPGDFITSFDYLMEKEALIVGTSRGLLLLHNVEDNATEIVGNVEGGVKCISPSPDGDLLGVVTGLGQMLVMTHDWDLLYEMALEDLPEDVSISETKVSSNYTFESPVSWRGDGKYFATLTTVHNSFSFHKKIKVWERYSGELHSVSEPKHFMGSVVEWMPSGVKIAAICDRKEEKKCPSIVFYERNGLERNAFSINEDIGSTIEILKWNCSSDLLAAVVRCERYDSLKIWHFSNNHWYLKQETRYPSEDGIRFMWGPTKPLELICWTLGAQITIFDFVWVTAVMENSTALVVDGSEILVTPLFLSLIPPPMFSFKLRFSSAVRDVAFHSKSSKNHLAASLSNGCLSVVEFPQLDDWEELEGKEFDVEASSSESSIESFIHLIWLDAHVLLGISHFGSRNGNWFPDTLSGKERLHGHYLLEIELVCSEDHVPSSLTCSGWHSKISNFVSLEEPVICIAPNPAKRYSALVQFVGGKIFEYTSTLFITGGAPVPCLQMHDKLGFLSSCPLMGVVPVADSETSQSLLFGLEDNSRLHVNGRILCHNCSSFSFYSIFANEVITHLILATKQDLLFIVDIVDVLHEQVEAKYESFLPVIKKRNEEKINYISIWEKGAKIVGVLHGDEAAVILQTYRGTLECIYPRKLVLTSIVNALVQGRFKDALLMVRRHRIDFNVLVDYCGWQAFIQLAPEFVRQVNNLSHVTEFICSVKNENIMETLYKNYISLPCIKDAKVAEFRHFEGFDAKTKVSSVLLAIRKALEEQVVESPARELCILTTLARSDPPALEEALKRVKAIREMELLSSDDPKRNSYPSAEDALKHLLWLSDSEAVYEAALGLYDLNLAAIVALNSQQDPKEFLPFLQELQNMPTLLMHYNIDLKLQRYENALRNIIMAGDTHHADCINLMKKNPELFPLGIQLITDPSMNKKVLEAWGDHLTDIKCFEDSAATYLCCNSLEKALKAYRACGNWSRVLTVAGFIRLGREEVVQLAHELCEELQALGKPGEAAKIALEYCGDVNAGINLLVSARDWEEALRVAFMHRREDLISELKIASLECANMLIGEYGEGLEKVGKYLARYLAVRQRRLLLAAKLQLDERPVNEVDDDTVSEVSSNFSGMSAYTTGTRKSSSASIRSSTSSKSRSMRRQKNKGKIRAGSPGEEMALVEHLKGMSLTTGAKLELKSLLVSLVMLAKEDIARRLQHIGEKFQLSQMAAVKLAEDAMSSDIIDEQAYSLDHYIQKVRKVAHSDTFSWQSKVLLSP
ncbi:elongator complex protein 1 [Diospyros lotus]|uniref:elongator complex protein 1 n=1 Tax=Diospyros lotus TaxID=55363 RepID=UPI00224FA969|nr:elongator complex protein 1 [Diospyros lotus]XP_052205429.1 elongator complex protein 1 [Diospyros lotus]XP_052205430.1 elongator complex protein 1 [Diospyros lotus]